MRRSSHKSQEWESQDFPIPWKLRLRFSNLALSTEKKGQSASSVSEITIIFHWMQSRKEERRPMCLQPTLRCSNVHPSAWMILFAILTPSCYLWLLITILNNFVKHVLQNSHLCRAFNLSMTTTGKKNPPPNPPIHHLDNVTCLDELFHA